MIGLLLLWLLVLGGALYVVWAAGVALHCIDLEISRGDRRPGWQWWLRGLWLVVIAPYCSWRLRQGRLDPWEEP